MCEEYLSVRPFPVICDRSAKFEFDIPAEWRNSPLLADGKKWSFSHPDGNDFTIDLKVGNGKFHGKLRPGRGHSGNCPVSMIGAAILPLHFPDMLMRLELTCPQTTPAPEAPGKTWLCLDIGNTRTCALLDLPDQEIAFYKVENNKEVGIFSSLCAGQTVPPDGKNVAFVRMGKRAADLRRDVAPKGSSVFSLSTPKRYFWDDCGDKKNLFVDGNKLVEINPKNVPVVDRLMGFAGNLPAKRLFMQGAVLELLELAEKTVGKLREAAGNYDRDSKGFGELMRGLRTEECDDDRYADIAGDLNELSDDYVTDMVCTCPAAWIQAQRQAYRKLIEDAVSLYCTPAKACHDLKFHMACDEATAVLMSYLKLRVCDNDRGNAALPLLLWLYEHGKIRIKGDAASSAAEIVCRIGVLDVGGGTSDLCIAELTCVADTPANTYINTKRLCSNGTDRAGDYLLLQVTNKIIVPMVAAWLLKPDFFNGDAPDDMDEWKKYLEWFRNVLKDGKKYIVGKSKRFARQFWFELAAEAMNAMHNAEDRDGELDLDFKDAVKHLNIRESLNDFWSFFQELMGKSSTGEYTNKYGDEEWLTWLDNNINPMENDKEELKSHLVWKKWMGDGRKTVLELFRECISAALSDTAMQMTSLLMVHDCDMVLFSGKTMENRLVQEFFRDRLPIPAESLDSEEDRDGRQDRRQDSKMYTAIGAEYYVRRNDPAMQLHIAIDGSAETDKPEKDEDFYWVVSVPGDEARGKRDEGVEFTTSEDTVYIKRRKFENYGRNDTPCYKLTHVRGNKDTNYSYHCVLGYVVNEENGRKFYGLKLASVTDNEDNDHTDEWELKVFMDNAGTNWLDTGIIKED